MEKYLNGVCAPHFFLFLIIFSDMRYESRESLKKSRGGFIRAETYIPETNLHVKVSYAQ